MIERLPLAQLTHLDLLDTISAVDDVVSYFTRRDDHDQIRDSIVTRYGLGIEQITDPESGSSTEVYSTFEKKQFKAQVDNGMLGTLSMGFGPKVVNALASLFTEPGQVFEFSPADGSDREVEKEGEFIQAKRANGNFNAALVRADKRSVQIGSSAVLIGYSGGGLTYQVLSPADMQALYAQTVIEDDVERPVDRTDIEDATAIIIRLDQVDLATWSYLGIYGRCESYPDGRYCTFRASAGTRAVPEPNDQSADVVDYKIDGNPCNPLTYLGNRYPELALPEYPIAVIYGGTTEDCVVMPVSTSLYADCLEVDTAGSHLLATSQDSARGTLAISRNEQGRGQPLPRTLHGAVALQAGQTIEHISHEPTASQNALDVLHGLMSDIASGYGVPDYMVVPGAMSALEAVSGVALAIKTRPLQKVRAQRVELNKPSVARIFTIESALLALYDDTAEAAALLTCTQTWTAGDLLLPENKLEAVQRIQVLLDKGVMDTIGAIREYHGLATDAEAIELYEKMQDRAKEYPSLAQPKKPALGLMGGNGNGKPARDDLF